MFSRRTNNKNAKSSVFTAIKKIAVATIAASTIVGSVVAGYFIGGAIGGVIGVVIGSIVGVTTYSMASHWIDRGIVNRLHTERHLLQQTVSQQSTINAKLHESIKTSKVTVAVVKSNNKTTRQAHDTERKARKDTEQLRTNEQQSLSEQQQSTAELERTNAKAKTRISLLKVQLEGGIVDQGAALEELAAIEETLGSKQAKGAAPQQVPAASLQRR